MLVGPPASDGMLDCPHLCGTGLEHRHIETQIVLLYLQTSVGDSVFEGSLLDGKRDSQGTETP